jgi:hypothetical protein
MARWRRAPLRSERAFSTLGQPQAGRMGDEFQHVPGRRRDGPASRRCPGNCDHVSPSLDGALAEPNASESETNLRAMLFQTQSGRCLPERDGGCGAASAPARLPARIRCKTFSAARHLPRGNACSGGPLRDARGLHPIGTAGPGDAASGCDACTPHGTRPFFAGHGVLPPKLAAGPAIRVDHLAFLTAQSI